MAIKTEKNTNTQTNVRIVRNNDRYSAGIAAIKTIKAQQTKED